MKIIVSLPDDDVAFVDEHALRVGKGIPLGRAA
jgi:hypothetical protein